MIVRATIARRQQTVAAQHPLELRGWKALRETLIKNEREFVQCAVQEPATCTVLSREESDEQGSSERYTRSLSVTAPTLVTDNSENSTYRPVSPSQMHIR